MRRYGQPGPYPDFGARTIDIMTFPHPMQLPRDTTDVGVAHVHDRETRRPLGRLAVVRYYLPAHFMTGVIGGKSPPTCGFPSPGWPEHGLNNGYQTAVRVPSGC